VLEETRGEPELMRPTTSRQAIPLGLIGARRSACVDRNATVSTACKLMRDQGLNDLVVTETRQDGQTCAGILSARDIVTRIVAVDLDADVVTVGDILWARTKPGRPGDTVQETLERLCASGGDAVPILDGNGNLAGVISLDDLLQVLPAS
jgi:CBS domain-containing protein